MIRAITIVLSNFLVKMFNNPWSLKKYGRTLTNESPTKNENMILIKKLN